MPKVRTLSLTFMKGHPRAGEPTHFIEMFSISMGIEKKLFGLNPIVDFSIMDDDSAILGLESFHHIKPKHHTIRMGRHFKANDELTLAVWSGKPYHSKQVKLWTGSIRAVNIVILNSPDWIAFYKDTAKKLTPLKIEKLAKNDGLEIDDFLAWFNLPEGKHEAQILIWNPEIQY